MSSDPQNRRFYQTLYGPRDDEVRIEIWKVHGDRWAVRSTAELSGEAARRLEEFVSFLNSN